MLFCYDLNLFSNYILLVYKTDNFFYKWGCRNIIMEIKYFNEFPIRFETNKREDDSLYDNNENGDSESTLKHAFVIHKLKF
ncbi:hypothetical protein KUTeg_000679 [Tegillarca granosa]|uniref:Uncharacterized protein n=1 Tax=Tegillarca granosa TaxID=220873 RepID=A0ABQ9FY73_TEGGR|nr:hypothetical protein KUTeg_000679 [Tegillarca granosa]